MNDKARKASIQIGEKKREVKYSTREFAAEYIHEQFKKDEFYVPIEYQRNFVWKPKQRCFFIESVLMGLPIPYMFFADADDGRIEIVDGAQRVNTIVAFMDNELCLKGLEILSEANGMYYKDFEPEIQRRFQKSSFRVVFLEEGTTVETRQEIFKRINSSGSPLKSAEKRRGSFEGPFKDLALELAKDDVFKQLAALSQESEKRYDGMELVTRFFAYTDGFPEMNGYNGEVAKYLDKYTEKMNQELAQHPDLMDEYEKRFKNMVTYASNALPSRGFRKSKNARSTPHARFESLAVGIGVAQKQMGNIALQNMEEWIDDEEYLKLITSDAANNKAKLIARIKFVVDKLQNYRVD